MLLHESQRLRWDMPFVQLCLLWSHMFWCTAWWTGELGTLETNIRSCKSAVCRRDFLLRNKEQLVLLRSEAEHVPGGMVTAQQRGTVTLHLPKITAGSIAFSELQFLVQTGRHSEDPWPRWCSSSIGTCPSLLSMVSAPSPMPLLLRKQLRHHFCYGRK